MKNEKKLSMNVLLLAKSLYMFGKYVNNADIKSCVLCITWINLFVVKYIRLNDDVCKINVAASIYRIQIVIQGVQDGEL